MLCFTWSFIFIEDHMSTNYESDIHIMVSKMPTLHKKYAILVVVLSILIKTEINRCIYWEFFSLSYCGNWIIARKWYKMLLMPYHTNVIFKYYKPIKYDDKHFFEFFIKIMTWSYYLENTEYVYKYYVNDTCKFHCTVLLDVYIFSL